jgi:putative two-component system response regulator
VVDDTPDNLTFMSGILRDRYVVKVAKSGALALQIAGGPMPPDLILLDIMMPEMDGYEVLRRLRAEERTRNIPTIFLTAMSSADDERYGLEMGVVDYVTKPVSAPILLARIANHLSLKAAADFLRDKSEFLEKEVERRTRDILAIQDVTIIALTSLAETRDSDTGNHIRRTQHFVRILAERLLSHPRIGRLFTPDSVKNIFRLAPLHDIGKVGIPDRILLKPGKLTPEEFDIMKTHTTLGYEAIQAAEDRLGSPVEFLSMAKEIVLSHHEKWDGSGYPSGLAGEAIPIGARIMAVADVYDALISRRVYKEPMPHEKAIAILREGRGSHFDPDVLDAFLVAEEEFAQVAAAFSDSAEDVQKKAEQIATFGAQPES